MNEKNRHPAASATVAIGCWELAAISHVYDAPNELTQIKYSLLILDRREYSRDPRGMQSSDKGLC